MVHTVQATLWDVPMVKNRYILSEQWPKLRGFCSSIDIVHSCVSLRGLEQYCFLNKITSSNNLLQPPENTNWVNDFIPGASPPAKFINNTVEQEVVALSYDLPTTVFVQKLIYVLCPVTAPVRKNINKIHSSGILRWDRCRWDKWCGHSSMGTCQVGRNTLFEL